MKKQIVKQLHKYYFEALVIMIIILLVANISVQAETYVESGDVGIAVSESIELIGAAAFIDSYRSQENAYAPLNATSEAIVTVNSGTNNSVSLFNNAIIKGDVYTGPGSDVDRAIRMWDRSSITGIIDVLEEEVVLPKISMPDAAPFNEESTGDFVLGYNEQTVVDYDLHVDDLRLTNESRLVITGNVVIVADGDVNVSGDSGVVIEPGATLDLYVNGGFDIAGWVNVTAADPEGLYVFMTGEGQVFDMLGGAAIYCVLQNPGGGVNLHEQAQFFGRMRAESVKCMGGVHVDLDSGFPSVVGAGGEITLDSMQGEELVAGSLYELTWTTEGAVDNVIIEYTSDGGDSWTTVDTIMNTGAYEWFVPEANSQECYVRVLDASDPSKGVVSNAFTIYVCELMYDLNGDCKVDTKDAELMAKEWMTSGNPFDKD